jgi:hypothetical protein
MKKPVIALRMHKGHVTINGEIVRISLPDGCLGFMLAFESKTAARKWDKHLSDDSLVGIWQPGNAKKDKK